MVISIAVTSKRKEHSRALNILLISLLISIPDNLMPGVWQEVDIKASPLQNGSLSKDPMKSGKTNSIHES